MVSSSSNIRVTCSPRCTVRRFLCSITLARNWARCLAYASSVSRLSRVITLSDRGFDFGKGPCDFAARGDRHAELPRDLRQREDAAHRLLALDDERVLPAAAAQRLEHMADAGAGQVGKRDHLDPLG